MTLSEVRKAIADARLAAARAAHAERDLIQDAFHRGRVEAFAEVEHLVAALHTTDLPSAGGEDARGS